MKNVIKYIVFNPVDNMPVYDLYATTLLQASKWTLKKLAPKKCAAMGIEEINRHRIDWFIIWFSLPAPDGKTSIIYRYPVVDKAFYNWYIDHI